MRMWTTAQTFFYSDRPSPFSIDVPFGPYFNHLPGLTENLTSRLFVKFLFFLDHHLAKYRQMKKFNNITSI